MQNANKNKNDSVDLYVIFIKADFAGIVKK